MVNIDGTLIAMPQVSHTADPERPKLYRYKVEFRGNSYETPFLSEDDGLFENLIHNGDGVLFSYWDNGLKVGVHMAENVTEYRDFWTLSGMCDSFLLVEGIPFRIVEHEGYVYPLWQTEVEPVYGWKSMQGFEQVYDVKVYKNLHGSGSIQEVAYLAYRNGTYVVALGFGLLEPSGHNAFSTVEIASDEGVISTPLIENFDETPRAFLPRCIAIDGRERVVFTKRLKSGITEIFQGTRCISRCPHDEFVGFLKPRSTGRVTHIVFCHASNPTYRQFIKL